MSALLPPVTLAEVTEEWLAERREIVVSGGFKLRPGVTLTIEVESMPRGKERAQWCLLTLPNHGHFFDCAATRDEVLRRLLTDPLTKAPEHPGGRDSLSA